MQVFAKLAEIWLIHAFAKFACKWTYVKKYANLGDIILVVTHLKESLSDNFKMFLFRGWELGFLN